MDPMYLIIALVAFDAARAIPLISNWYFGVPKYSDPRTIEKQVEHQVLAFKAQYIERQFDELKTRSEANENKLNQLLLKIIERTKND